MIDHVWTVICSRAIVDNATNVISLEGIIAELTFHGEPPPQDAALAVQLEVAMLWVRSDQNVGARGETRLSLIDPNDNVLGSVIQDINLGDKWQRFRNRFRISALPVRESGRHFFRTELRLEGVDEWTFIKDSPLDIVFSPPAPEAETDVAE
jgi:hypothetical protein